MNRGGDIPFDLPHLIWSLGLSPPLPGHNRDYGYFDHGCALHKVIHLSILASLILMRKVRDT
jgi:hypothetical protein